MEKEKPRRLRFMYDDDIIMLREIVAQNPILNPEKWETVKMNIENTNGKSFQIRTIKQHLQLLLELFLKKDTIAKKKSGDEEPYSERDVLLQEISSICTEFDCSVKKKRVVVSKEKKISELGKKTREKYAILNMQVAEDENDNNLLVDYGEFAKDIADQTRNYIHTNNQYTETVNSSDIEFQNEKIISTDFLQEHNYVPLENNFTNAKEGNLQNADIHKPVDKENTKQNEGNSDLNKTVSVPMRKRPNKSRPLRKDALGYLNDKNEKEYKIRQKQLELDERKILIEERKLNIEERKVELQEKKHELDAAERHRKMEIEKERLELEMLDKKLTNNIMDSQQKIIDCLLNKLE